MTNEQSQNWDYQIDEITYTKGVTLKGGEGPKNWSYGEHVLNELPLRKRKVDMYKVQKKENMKM